MKVKHPEVSVSGLPENAYGIIGEVSKALRRGGVSAAEISEFQSEAMSGDYDNLIQTAMRWVDVS